MERALFLVFSLFSGDSYLIAMSTFEQIKPLDQQSEECSVSMLQDVKTAVELAANTFLIIEVICVLFPVANVM